MDESEAQRYRIEIAQILRHEGFGWIVDEVQAVIATGKLVQKRVLERDVSAYRVPQSEAPRARSRRASRPSTDVYTSSEQLELLIGAIENVLPNRDAVENTVMDILSDVEEVRFTPEVTDIAFPEEIGMDQRQHLLVRSDRAKQSEIADTSRSILEELRSRLNAE